MMGRNRKKDRDLPPRMHRKNGAYWHKRGQKWTRLAALSDPVTAFARFAEIEQQQVGQTVRDAINRYLVRHVPTKAERTQKDYRRICTMLSKWAGAMSLDALRTRHVARLSDAQDTPSNARKVVAILSGIYKEARHAGWVEYNPCEGVKLPPPPRRTYVPPWDELHRLREAVSPQMCAAMDIALMTALRLGDMLALTRSDIRDGVLSVGISKTNAQRAYRVTAELRDAFRRARDNRPASIFLIPNRRGQAYTPDGWESNWQRAKKNAGFAHIRWHDLRTRALTDAARIKGRDYAQALAAHADGSTTEIYIRDRGEVAIEPMGIVDNPENSRQQK